MAAPSNALLTYQALLRNGYSTTQAIGILANALHENSGFNPELTVTDSNGLPSRGLFMFNAGGYPGAGSMQTGNVPADINSQVRFLVLQGFGPRSRAASGASAADVAGNWAQYFEVCQGCSAGGSQWQARRASAATVAGWVSGGNWPTSSGSGGPSSGAGSGATGSGTGSGGTGGTGTGTGSGGSGAQTTGTTQSGTCLWTLTIVGCVLTKTQARAIIGGLCILAAGITAIIGADLLLKAAGLGGSGAGKVAAGAGEFVALFPPAEAAGVALSGAGGRVNRVAGHRTSRRRTATGEANAVSSRRRAATGVVNADTSRRRAATGEKNAATAQRRAATYKYRSRTDREIGRSRAKTYRKDAGTRRYAAETGRQRETRLATARRSRPASSAAQPKVVAASAPARRTTTRSGGQFS